MRTCTLQSTYSTVIVHINHIAPGKKKAAGVGKTPAFHNIDIDANGNTVGLF